MSLRDVRVTLTETPLDFEFLAHLTKKIVLSEQLFFYHFESTRLVASLLDSLVYFAEFTRANLLKQLEVVDDEREARWLHWLATWLLPDA